MMESKFRNPARRRSALVLAGTVLFALLLVLVVRAATAGTILRRTGEARQAVMQSVAPSDTTAFSQLPYDPAMADDMYAAWQGEALAGYCVEVTADGFGGPMKLMVGVSAQGSVTGVAILSHSETPGMGGGMEDASFLEALAAVAAYSAEGGAFREEGEN